jgi:uncharacterized membrane protein YcjF (UPF0283 family)
MHPNAIKEMIARAASPLDVLDLPYISCEMKRFIDRLNMFGFNLYAMVRAASSSYRRFFDIQ